ncbi:MAG TPA: ATP-binding protein [Candidatus Eisenbacteria bacterium]|nr:ATP-binding protein [Candidatus Eisenbacteria bacterium]
MGYTKVDLLHLLEDLRDAYADSLEETVLTELVANALDSGAGTIRVQVDPAARLCVVLDDGAGMPRRDLRRFHDIAASSKTRGEGIGFAGVGAKLALLMCERVVTETRRASSHVASSWRLASRNHAPWEYVPPPGRLGAHGTAVALQLENPLSPLLDRGHVEATLRRHYAPFFDPRLAGILFDHYRHPIGFEVNGMALGPEPGPEGEHVPLGLRFARKRKPSAVGWLLRSPAPLPEAQRGLAISTLGKVIRRGWDWLGLAAHAPDRIGGLVEVPALADCLILNKADFVRTGARGATFLAHRKALQERVARQLEAWGDAPDAGEQRHRRVARPVERDLERVLIGLADDFPLLASLVERREGGQRRLPIGPGPGGAGAVSEDLRAAGAAGSTAENTLDAPSRDDGSNGTPAAPPLEPDAEREGAPATAMLPGAPRARRPGRYGLMIQFERAPEDSRLGRLVESTVWVNEAHPAYERAAASRSEGYHVALAVALALAPLAVEASQATAFVTAFLDRWGRALRSGGHAARV